MPDLEIPCQHSYKEISSCLFLYTVSVLVFVVFEGFLFGCFSLSLAFLFLLCPSLPGNRNMMCVPQTVFFSFMSCFLGVGKTSIARSIARALNRQVHVL